MIPDRNPHHNIPRTEFNAVLRMLIRRATLADRWRAHSTPGHWLNAARRQVLPEQRCAKCMQPLDPQTGECAVHGKHLHELVFRRAAMVCRTCTALDANDPERSAMVVVLVVLGACLAFIAGVALTLWRMHTRGS